jgi:hypothetical protein
VPVIAVESPTATFQLNDFSMSNIVSGYLWRRSCLCFLSHEDDEGPEIGRNVSFYENEHMMGFKLTNTGQMI